MVPAGSLEYVPDLSHGTEFGKNASIMFNNFIKPFLAALSIEGLNFVKKDSPIAELANDEYTTYSISNINKGDEARLI